MMGGNQSSAPAAPGGYNPNNDQNYNQGAPSYPGGNPWQGGGQGTASAPAYGYNNGSSQGTANTPSYGYNSGSTQGTGNDAYGASYASSGSYAQAAPGQNAWSNSAPAYGGNQGSFNPNQDGNRNW